MSELETENLSASPAGRSVPATGNPRVDEVVESLEVLNDLPVEEHLQVFEAAQETLRAALISDPHNSSQT